MTKTPGRQAIEALIDGVEDAVRGAINAFPGALGLASTLAREHDDVAPADHTLAAAVAVSKSVANYVDAGCADGTVAPYGADAHRKVDAAAKVLRSALSALDGLHKEFGEKEKADA